MQSKKRWERNSLSTTRDNASSLACHSAKYSSSDKPSTSKKRSSLRTSFSSSSSSSSVRKSRKGVSRNKDAQTSAAGAHRRRPLTSRSTANRNLPPSGDCPVPAASPGPPLAPPPLAP